MAQTAMTTTGANGDDSAAKLARIEEVCAASARQLVEIGGLLAELVSARQIKEWYSTEEFARLVDRNEFTVREWCRLGRINAKKLRSGRGPHASWTVGHGELQRYRREGLLPDLNRRPA